MNLRFRLLFDPLPEHALDVRYLADGELYDEPGTPFERLTVALFYDAESFVDWCEKWAPIVRFGSHTGYAGEISDPVAP